MKGFLIFMTLLAGLAPRSFANGGENFAFHVGEKLTYQIFWGPFVVGRATLEVKGIEPVDGHDCYHIVATAKTSGLANWMFPVDNKVDSWLDTKELFTRKFRQDRLEGKHRRNDESHFNYEQNEIVTKNFGNGKEKRLAINGPVLDVVASLFFVRAQNLMIDSEKTFLVNGGDANYTVSIRPDQRKELWVRPVGDVQALRIEPDPTLKIVSANKGRMWFWVSDDTRHLPLIVASDLKIGSAKLVLFKISSANPALDKAIKPDTAQLPDTDDTVASRH